MTNQPGQRRSNTSPRSTPTLFRDNINKGSNMRRRIDWQQVIITVQDDLFYSQKEIAARLGVTQQAVTNWRNRVRAPAPASKRQLTKVIEDAGLDMQIFYKDYDPVKDNVANERAEELLMLFQNLPAKRQDFILELDRFEHKQNI